MKKFHIHLSRIFLLFVTISLAISAKAINDLQYISTSQQAGSFQLFEANRVSPVYISDADFEGVKIAAQNLQNDIEKVSGLKPELLTGKISAATHAVIVGTVGKNNIIDQLIKKGKLDGSYVAGKWETFLITVIDNPLKGVDQALVIAGSDKRGTIFGIYDLCEKMGISPWHFWADVPAKQHQQLYILPGNYTLGEPKVKYRGIFINDEAPALAGWAEENYDGFTSGFYIHVFDLILRLKGNFLWPAMWGRAFYDDDPMNPVLADKYGVVISTSHHEPLMRAHVEWSRYGEGPWNYDKNKERLQEFWRTGIKRMEDNESLVTIGMRGDGDEPMSEGTAIALLEEIVKDQREIIEEVTGEHAEETPQVWALYKEVQDYYEMGMRVPDDVTLLLADDNWGNVRILPDAEDQREGGYGMYYHFDYVGGPRNYKWINTNQIEKVWEQMHLTYQHGVDRIWLVNVGDIKPMEFPISFFLDYAWNPEQWTAEQLPEYYARWSAKQFSAEHATEIGELLAMYSKYNARRKPEMLSPETYSLVHFNEWQRVVDDYNCLVNKAKQLYKEIPENQKDAFYQLVLFPVQASANLNELYYATAKNRLYHEQQRASTNEYADKVQKLFEKDQELTEYYHQEMADGKWSHMMSQTHIGYTYWQQPEKNAMPEVQEIALHEGPSLGVAVQNSENWYPETTKGLQLPEFDPINDQTWQIELFNQGQQSLHYQLNTNDPWIDLPLLSDAMLENQVQLPVSVNWEKVPDGTSGGTISISGSDGSTVTINVPVNTIKNHPKGFVENNNVVAMDAANYTNAIENNGSHWQPLPNYGKTSSAVTLMPVTSDKLPLSKSGSWLEYDFHVFDSGTFEIVTYVSPTLNYNQSEGLQFAVSLNDEKSQVINMHAADSIADWKGPHWWNEAVGNNIRTYVTTHHVAQPGNHVLKFWGVDPGVVLQRLVIWTDGKERKTYLGPPESKYVE